MGTTTDAHINGESVNGSRESRDSGSGDGAEPVQDVDTNGESSIRVHVRCSDIPHPHGGDWGGADRIWLTVTHYEDYGILVTGSCSRELGLRALKKAGYPMDAVLRLPWRPTMVDQEESRWPFGLWVGGKPAIAFYFNVGP